MTDEKTATRALTGNRSMSVFVPRLQYVWDSLAATWNADGANTQWRLVDDFLGWSYSTYIDTSGYTRDELTIMFESIGQLEAGRTQFTNQSSARLHVVDLVLTQAISEDEEQQIMTEMRNSNIFPGSFLSALPYDWEMVQYGRFREYLATTVATGAQDVYAPVADNQFGSLEPTTADKLHVYRFVMLVGWTPADNTTYTIRIPSSRMVTNTDIVKETDLSFMMRQKRSFELSQ
tara:strand:+ start:201 stop:899 length:699 start_codon:yes stop_codon:yes gene_type:complete